MSDSQGGNDALALIEHSKNVIRRGEMVCTITFHGQSVQLLRGKGVEYLLTLLEHPQRALHVSDLDGARGRSSPSDPLSRADTERGRKAVTNRIRATISRIREAHPQLADHLHASVRTGTRCCYRPYAPVAWEVTSE